VGFRPKVVNGVEPVPYFIWPGVNGRAYASGPYVVLWIIEAVEEGSGDVGRMLDRLDGSVIISNVSNPRLRGMLERRKWFRSEIEGCDIWYRAEIDRPPAVVLLK